MIEAGRAGNAGIGNSGPEGHRGLAMLYEGNNFV
jgi:hypothetical protein